MNAKKVYALKAQKRESNENVAQLRQQGFIPVIMYGKGFSPVQLKVVYNEFVKLFAEAGESSLIDLKTEGLQDTKVIVKEVQTDPIKDHIIHLDLYKINMAEPIYTEIPFNFIGEAPVIKELGGILVKHIDGLEVKCLPGDLVHDLTVDVSQLREFSDTIKVGDLEKIPGIEFMLEDDIQIISVSEPRKVEEAIPEVSEAVAVDSIEKVGEDKADDQPDENPDSQPEAKF